MELYLLTKELPTILTKPGLLQQVPVGGPGGGGTPPAATPPAEKPGAATPAEGTQPAEQPGAATPAEGTQPAEQPEAKPQDAKPAGPTEPKGKQGKEEAKPAETATPDDVQSGAAKSIGAGGDPASNATNKVRNGLENYDSVTTGKMDSIFGDYWNSDTAFTKQNVQDTRAAMEKQLDVERKAYKAAAGDQVKAREINGRINWLEDRIARTKYLDDIAGDYESSVSALDNRDYETGRNFLTTYDKKIKELGNQTVTNAYLDTDRTASDVSTVQDQWEEKTGGMMGPQSAGGGGFLKGIQDFNTGVGAVTATTQGLTGLSQSAQQLGYSLSGGYGYPPGFGVYNSGFGGFGPYGGFGGGYGGAGGFMGGYGAAGGGFGGGYGVGAGGFGGGFNLALGGFGLGGYYNQRAQDRKLNYIINMLMFSIAAGNIDAISTALIMIARQGKGALQRTAMAAIGALQSYEQQQTQVTNMMQGLNAQNNPNYASQLQSLSARMNTYSSNRQMIVSLLRDVKSMSDELENMAKSYQDTSLQHQKRQMIFA